jgi:thioredoxin reductase (NADPH)
VDSTVEEFLGQDGKFAGARIRKLMDRRHQNPRRQRVFIAIGHDPRSELFRGQIALDDDG